MGLEMVKETKGKVHSRLMIAQEVRGSMTQ